MTERKPQGVPFESWVDQLIREAQERGEFDDLPGTGKPLPGIDRPLEEDWWVRQKIREEELPSDALLPPALQLRRELAALPDAVRDLPDEATVRERVREVNLRVAAWIRIPTGPVLPVVPADPDAVVAAWRTAREPAVDDDASSNAARPTGDDTPSKEASQVVDAGGGEVRRRRWWHLRRR